MFSEGFNLQKLSDLNKQVTLYPERKAKSCFYAIKQAEARGALAILFRQLGTTFGCRPYLNS